MSDQYIQDNSVIIDQIAMKQSGYPYYATERIAKSIMTDYNEFPFRRFWRPYGDVYKRYAGFHPVPCCPTPARCFSSPQECLTSCFQYPCSTVYPHNTLMPPKCISLYR